MTLAVRRAQKSTVISPMRIHGNMLLELSFIDDSSPESTSLVPAAVDWMLVYMNVLASDVDRPVACVDVAFACALVVVSVDGSGPVM